MPDRIEGESWKLPSALTDEEYSELWGLVFEAIIEHLGLIAPVEVGGGD